MENDINSIKPSQIEKTLISLFENEKKANFIKASLFNLIIYTEADERESYLIQLTKSLIKKFPCRIIFIKESNKEGDFLNTNVSPLRPEGENEGFFCEFIYFEISKSYKERISYIITPHIIADLPVYLLFAKDPSLGDTPTSLGLDNFPMRIIFDSECMEHMSMFASYIHSLHHENIEIGDLNWARFSSWRKLLSKFFSNKEKLKTLALAEEITLCYNSHSTESFHHNKIQATYMQGWLGVKMGWEFETVLCHEGNLSVTYRSKYGTHKIHIEGSCPIKTLPPGRIVSITIKNKTETTSFTRDETSPHIVKICHSTNNRCEMPVLYPLSKEGSGTSITREIYYRDTSNDFLAVLELISHWKTGVICS